MTIYNARGKKVKHKRWIITRSDPLSARPYSMYLTSSGLCGYRAERAAKFKSEKEAEEEAEWFRANYPRFTWIVER